MNIKNALAIGIFVTAASAMALDSCKVTEVTARQRYPWNGLVDVSYTVVGSTNGIDCAYGHLEAVDQKTGKTYEAKTFVKPLDLTEGTHTAIWDTAADHTVVSESMTFRVSICTPPFYRVIDVSEGASASVYPVIELADAPAEGWSDEYKIDKIVLRRIDGTNGVYYAGVFEITEAQWARVMGGTMNTTPESWRSYNKIRGDAETYNWPDSNAVDPTSFMGRLRQKTGLATLDLPSEAEWEYAARAGVTTTWLCGDSETGLGDYAWYKANSGDAAHPVGALRANAWGLYDVHGNVWEWCLDRVSSYDYDGRRVLRGGSYIVDASHCAFSYRNGYTSSYGSDLYGFRLFCRAGSNDDDDGHGGAEIICEAESPATFVDSRHGIRYDSGTNAVHTLNWNAAWVGGDASAEVVIADGETELAHVTGVGSCTWTNAVVGLHTLTYTTFIDGVAQPEVYTADCLCLGEAVSHVTARRILPWAGLVEIAYDLSAGVEALSQVTNLFTQVRMTDNSRDNRDEYFVARPFTRTPTYENGRHVLVWDAVADGVSLKTSSTTFSVAVTGEDTEPLYRVIDVSAGSDATRYPVVYRDDVPMGGWGDEYKTEKIVLRRIDGTNGVYYAGVFEVTEAQWDKVMGGTSASTKPKGSVSYNTIRGDAGTYDWPYSNTVDPTSFMGRLRQKTELATLDLPSEAEWEYAARAGVTTAWLCGDSETGLGDYAWYGTNGGNSTQFVGTRRANAWGLYDVHGNVSEWCLDRYSDDGSRVLRGGAYNFVASSCAFAYRNYDSPSYDYGYGAYGNGFRLFCRSEAK